MNTPVNPNFPYIKGEEGGCSLHGRVNAMVIRQWNGRKKLFMGKETYAKIMLIYIRNLMLFPWLNEQNFPHMKIFETFLIYGPNID